MPAIPTSERETLLHEGFSAPLNPTVWTFPLWSPVGNPSFFGRTQIRQSLPEVAGGVLRLRLDTFDQNGPGKAFIGAQITSVDTFSLSAGGIAFEFRARLPVPVPGVVLGLFGYEVHAPGQHDEIDFELLGNDVAAGRPRAQTNIYADEPNDAGHPVFVPLAGGLTAFHTYRMEWTSGRVRWFIDGTLARETTENVPSHPLAANANIWAPDWKWQEAYSARLVPAATAAENISYFAEVDELRIVRLVAADGGAAIDLAPTTLRQAEGTGGTTGFTFILHRSGDTGTTVSTDWAVQGGGAKGTVAANAADFAGGVLPTGTMQFAAGQTTATITVPLIADAAAELNESFTITLSNPSAGATLGTAKATAIAFNDDTVLSIARLSAAKSEGDSGTTSYTFTVTRAGITAGVASTAWKVSGGGVAGTTAASAADFAGNLLPGGVVSFAAGQTSRVITLAVAGEQRAELNESFTVTLSNASPGIALGKASATGVIFDDDTIHSTSANQTLTGTEGPDVFMLGGGLDVIAGKGGVDAFRFLPGAIGPAGSNATAFEDFNRAVGEKLDLSRIDAIGGTLTNDAFSFIGAAAFAGVAGQLRWEDQGTIRLIQGDVNGDSVADLTILVKAAGPVETNWFVL